jgi:MOSC domain-containing protein YiiM
VLPGAHPVRLGIRRQLREPVHGVAHGGALAGCQVDTALHGGHPSITVCTMQETQHGTLLRKGPRHGTLRWLL